MSLCCVLSRQRLHQWEVSMLPLSENSVQVRDLSVRARLWCHNAISRIFTPTILLLIDDRCLKLRIFGRTTRAESCQCAGDHELTFACAGGRFASGVNQRSTLVACFQIISPVVFSFTHATLGSAAGFIFSDMSFPACFGSPVRSSPFWWGSRSATITAAKTTEPRSPAATKVVLRFKLLIALSALPPFLLEFDRPYSDSCRS